MTMGGYGDGGYGDGGYGEDAGPGLLTALAAQSAGTTTTGLTNQRMAQLLQAFTCACLGIDPGAPPVPGQPAAFSQVRVEYPPRGQPAWGQQDNVCFVRAMLGSDAYAVTRDQRMGLVGDGVVEIQHLYARSWSWRWTFYGPDSLDRCRGLKTAMLSDLAGYNLAQSSLYLLPDVGEPTRAPELFEGGWWERVDLMAQLYEGVTDTTSSSTGASVELLTIGATQTSDVTLSAGGIS